MRRLKRLLGEEVGSDIVEFALAATAFLTLFFGIVEFSMAMYTSGFLAYGAQEGTRYWMVHGSDWTTACSSTTIYDCKAATTDVQNYILSLPHPGVNLQASNITATAMTTTATGSACVAYSQGCQVKVKINYTFQLSLPFYSPNIGLTSTSIETIQD